MGVFFIENGECGYVLPKQSNFKYINIQKGYNFGEIDIIAGVLENNMDIIEDWIRNRDLLKRYFTV